MLEEFMVKNGHLFIFSYLEDGRMTLRLNKFRTYNKLSPLFILNKSDTDIKVSYLYDKETDIKTIQEKGLKFPLEESFFISVSNENELFSLTIIKEEILNYFVYTNI